MHILLRYYESPCATRDNKVKDALQTMGSSVVIGGLSTFLGVVPLLFSTSSLMKSLFFGFWGMVILGILHGTMLLPVLLSYVGPIETAPMTIASMTPDGMAEMEKAKNDSDIRVHKDTGSFSVPTSDSSARPHLESDDLSGPSSPKNLPVAGYGGWVSDGGAGPSGLKTPSIVAEEESAGSSSNPMAPSSIDDEAKSSVVDV